MKKQFTGEAVIKKPIDTLWYKNELDQSTEEQPVVFFHDKLEYQIWEVPEWGKN